MANRGNHDDTGYSTGFDDEVHPGGGPPDDMALELRALFTPPRPIPPEVDRRILARAEAELLRLAARPAPTSRRRGPLGGRLHAVAGWARACTRQEGASLRDWRVWAGLGAASCLATAILVATLAEPRRLGPDIRDAYRLALLLERGDPVDPRFDVTGDGRIDAADVDALARAAVSLDRESPS